MKIFMVALVFLFLITGCASQNIQPSSEPTFHLPDDVLIATT